MRLSATVIALTPPDTTGRTIHANRERPVEGIAKTCVRLLPAPSWNVNDSFRSAAAYASQMGCSGSRCIGQIWQSSMNSWGCSTHLTSSRVLSRLGSPLGKWAIFNRAAFRPILARPQFVSALVFQVSASSGAAMSGQVTKAKAADLSPANQRCPFDTRPYEWSTRRGQTG